MAAAMLPVRLSGPDPLCSIRGFLRRTLDRPARPDAWLRDFHDRGRKAMPTTWGRSELRGLRARQERDHRSGGSGPGQPGFLEAVARQIRERRARAVLRAAGRQRQRRQRAC
jgi:hypothetical protein